MATEVDSSEQAIVLLADKLDPLVVEQLSQVAQVVVDASLSGDALQEKMAEINPRIVVVRSTKVHQPHMEAAPNLGLIIRGGAGTNNIDKAFASSQGIYVANCPGKNAIAVAELVVGHLINMDRRIADNVLSLRLGQWSKKEYSKKARGLYGRTIAILGCGQIGLEVAKRVQAFGMHVKGYDPFLSEERAKELAIEYAHSPLEAATNADALTVHVPLLDSTRNLVNAEILDALNDGAYVINASRGGIVDEEAMVEAIERKGLRFGADTFANEPKATDNVFEDVRISSNNSIYGTHHIGASTDQASEAVGQAVVEIAQGFLRKGSVKNAVNMISERNESFSLNIRHQVQANVLVGVLSQLAQASVPVQQMENKIFGDGSAGCVRIQIGTIPNAEVLDAIRQMGGVLSLDVGRLGENDKFF